MSLFKKIFSFKKKTQESEPSALNSEVTSEKEIHDLAAEAEIKEVETDKQDKSSEDCEQQELYDKPQVSWLKRLSMGLSRSSKQLNRSIADLLTKKKLDDNLLMDLEDILIQSDFGLEVSQNIINKIGKDRYGKDISAEEVNNIIAKEVENILSPVAKPLSLPLDKKPHVILMVGVNGSGKTTSIGKLAAKLTNENLKVMLAAGDTFRAAAVEQLQIWGKNIGCEVVTSALGSDAASLSFDAYQQAKNKDIDVLIIDTAGRLQNKVDLMEELKKIIRVLKKLDPEIPNTTLQTIDATTGQNALKQVEAFKEAAGVTGLIVTKLDGTAKGGILVDISQKFSLPVHFIGVGEAVEDLEPFSAKDFAQALLPTTTKEEN